MFDTLELVPRESDARAPAPAPATPKTDVAMASSAALDLAKIDLTDVALAQFGKWREHVAGVKQNLSTLALDLSTQSKVDEAKSLRQRLINQPRADVRKVSKELKSKLAKVSKAIGAEEDAAVLAYDEAEKLISPQIDARQQELDAEKEAARIAEANRKAAHEDGITRIRSYLDMAQGLPSERIARGIAALEAMTFGDEWEEYAVQAANAQCETIDALRKLHASTVAKEQAEAEAKRQAEVRELLAGLTKHVTDCFGKTADFISLRVDLLASHVYSEGVGAEVLAAHEAALTQLRTMHALAVQQEALAAQRAQQEARDRVLAAFVSAQAEVQVAPPAVEPSAPKNGDLQERAADEPVAIHDSQYSEARDSQQVLKAEPGTADATDREIPAMASPSVGSMGTGQPADAGPAGESAAIYADVPGALLQVAAGHGYGVITIDAADSSIETSEADAIEPPLGALPVADTHTGTDPVGVIRDAAALVGFLNGELNGKFKSHPKPSAEWWATLRVMAENLGPRLKTLAEMFGEGEL